MTDEALFNLINGCVGILGYYETRATEIERQPGRIGVHYQWAGKDRVLVFDADTGKMLPDEGR